MGDATNQSLLTANHGYELGDTHAHLKHPPHPERERHSRMGVKSEGGRTKRLCCLLGGRAATLRGSKLAKGS